MFSLVEALNYRCLKYVRQELSGFQVLVGANASGKSTFLDVIAFLGDLVSEGLEVAVFDKRSQNFQDLTWGRTGRSFELAVEAVLPEDRRKVLANPEFNRIRYEVEIGLGKEADELSILGERVLLKTSDSSPALERDSFPTLHVPPLTLALPEGRLGSRTIVGKTAGGTANWYSEISEVDGGGASLSFKVGQGKSALRILPAEEHDFSATTWLRDLLLDGIQRIILNSLLIRKASPPGRKRAFEPDGSNLPWVVADLEKKNPELFRDWIRHLQTALPDVENVRTIEREDDKHRYMMLVYKGGLEVPAWMASDGTLRLLALTLLGYLPDSGGVYLIEEPENGIHPKAVEAVFQSLSSAYGSQILLASHSPVILSVVRPEDVLCFAKTDEGATDVVRGSDHPSLRQWRGEVNLGVLFAGGVLG